MGSQSNFDASGASRYHAVPAMTTIPHSRRPTRADWRPRPAPPPGPRGHPVWGTAAAWRSDTLGLMRQLVGDYGTAVRYHYMLGFHGYLFAHPEHNRRILQDNYANYHKGHPVYAVMRAVLGGGLLTSDGDAWLRRRRQVQPAFHRARVPAIADMMVERTDAMLERWDERAADGTPIEVGREMMRLTLEVVGRALFGAQLGPDAAEVGEAFTAMNEEVAALTLRPFAPLLVRIPFLPGTRRLLGAGARLTRVVDRMIAVRARAGDESPDDGDLLTMLSAVRDEATGQGLTTRELHDEVMTVMLAGHETTANALTWTFYLLSEHPSVEARLRAELRKVLGGRAPAAADLGALSYTRAVLEESMRLYPPVYALGRMAHAADEVGGYRVPGGAVITLSPFLTHRLPEFWDEPERFDPERFLPERSVDRPKYAYLPFSGGPRQCIGNVFAMTEAQLILATVVRRYSLRLVANHPIEPWPLITLRPRYGMPMHVEAV
jgi:cytochrome P450